MADSSSVEFEDSDVIEIIPAEEYDALRAKLKASISWILTKAYGSSIPPQLKDPFYENAKGQLQVKPQLINLMTSSELYCQACSNMFSDRSSQWQGHWSIIQVLSRKGIYVAEAGETAVTETVLMHTAPFKVVAHLALIDALMKAYASEIASVEHVVQAVRRYSSFNASSELPSNVEEALVFWVNKTCTALANRGDLDIIQGESHQKVRIVSKTTPRDPKIMPKMEDVMNDLGDGCCVAAVISFYQPETFPVADVCLKESLGIADSLYNLRLIRTFCDRQLVLKCFHFTYEDLLYGRENLLDNALVFLAELFFLLEAAESGGDDKDGAVTETSSMRHVMSPNLPQVSSATKRSFQKTADDGRHLSEKISVSPGNLTARQPLLQKRTSCRRSQSLCSPQDRDTVRRSVIAWQDDQDIRQRQSQGSTLLENVSMSWDADVGETDVDPVSSADLADFEVRTPRQVGRSHVDDPEHPDFMEVVSVNSGQVSSRSARHSLPGVFDRHEPLMPAKLRPSKEKGHIHSKAEERGDRTPRKKMVSPTKAMRGGKLSPSDSGALGRASPAGSAGQGEGGAVSQRSSSSDETIVTPLASADLATPRSVDTISTSSDASVTAASQQQQQQAQQMSRSGSGYEAFTVVPDSSTEAQPTSPRRTVSRGPTPGEPPATSYTLESQVHDSQTAREVGLPVIGPGASDLQADGEISARLVGASREGSVGSSRSSGDYSDHESHKIHQDHKARESLKQSPRRGGDVHAVQAQRPAASQPPQPSQVHAPKPGQLITDLLPQPDDGHKAKPGTTSFAEIRRMKGLGNVDNSGYVYMQHGQDPGGQANGSNLKTGFAQKADGGTKRTTFARLPNETTWQQSAQRHASAQGASTSAASEAAASNGEPTSPPTSELSQLRLKLEEKRREIERKKQRQEVQTARMRQRLGKAAFMRVINKHDEPAGSSSALTAQWGVRSRDATDSAAPVSTSALSQALLQERLGQVGPGESGGGRPSSLATISPASSNSTSASQSPCAAGRAFSREGIQQTIDGVRRRWFHGSDPEGDIIRAKEEAEEDGMPVGELSSDMMQSCPPSVAAAAFGYTQQAPRPSSSLGLEARASPANLESGGQAVLEDAPTVVHPQVRELSQSPRRTPERKVSSSGSGEYEEYDQSLNKLNRSLTELQGEIKRLSLQQQEQFRAANQQDAGPTSAAPQQHHQQPQQPPPIPQQQQQPQLHPHRQHSQPQPIPHPQHTPPQQPQQTPTPPQQQAPSSRTMHGGRVLAQHPPLTDLSSPSLVPSTEEPSPPPSTTAAADVVSSHPEPDAAPAAEAEAAAAPAEEDTSSGSGFFVSFLGEGSPRKPKPKPKLGKGREAERKDTSGDVLDAGRERVPPLHGGLAAAGGGEGGGSSNSGSQHSLQGGSDDGSSGVSYMLGQDAAAMDQPDSEFQKKKERLFQQQQRRKEMQEKRRMGKEMETQRRLEQKMQKEEEQERKKADEKSRRDAIFQKYLQKKQDQDDDRPPVTRRERSNHGQPRPKSMFAKTKADLDDAGSRGMSTHSSQEDLSSNTSPSGSNAPLSPSPFRLNPNSRGKIRKAVSCNQLTQNGSQGATTYRRPPSPRGRPPSPDLLRLKRCGLFNDSASDSGSYAGSWYSDYTGPKLFVKPSAKSNRHIIINALSYCCLAGIVNTDMKNKVLEEIARSTAKHFLILFRDHGCQYRGLYSFEPDSEEAYKIMGVGPRQITSEMVEKFYKYNSGGKSFTEVTSTKHLSVSIDAVVLMNVYWKSKATPASKR